MTSHALTYFLHIPKTAGTSTTEYFYDSLPAGTICPHRLWDGLITAGEDELRQWRVYIGHFGGLLPLWLRAWPDIVTVLRCPVARTISHIKHVRRGPEHPLHKLAQGLSVKDYCFHPILSRSVENFQARYLASLSWSLDITRTAEPGARNYGDVSVAFEDALHSLQRGPYLHRYAERALESMKAVGIAENHHRTLELFAAALGLPGPKSEYRANIGATADSLGLEITQDDYAAIEAVTEIDRALYERAVRLFQRACAEHGVPDAA